MSSKTNSGAFGVVMGWCMMCRMMLITSFGQALCRRIGDDLIGVSCVGEWCIGDWCVGDVGCAVVVFAFFACRCLSSCVSGQRNGVMVYLPNRAMSLLLWFGESF